MGNFTEGKKLFFYDKKSLTNVVPIYGRLGTWRVVENNAILYKRGGGGHDLDKSKRIILREKQIFVSIIKQLNVKMYF